jgi:cellulose synthase (UDP-forming)
VVLWALINVMLRIKRPYMITPKGKAASAGPRPLTVYGPYIFLTAFPLLAVWVPEVTASVSVISGYYGLVLANAIMGAAVLATTLGMDIKQIAARHGASLATLRGRAGIVLALVCLLALLTVSVAAFGHQAVHAMNTAQA